MLPDSIFVEIAWMEAETSPVEGMASDSDRDLMCSVHLTTRTKFGISLMQLMMKQGFDDVITDGQTLLLE